MVDLVLDASIALALILEEEIGGDFAGLADIPAVAPAIWPLEVANVLLMAFRRKRIDGEAFPLALRHAASLLVEIDHAGVEIVLSATADLADRHGLTIYDASYLELALRRGLPIASLDRKLRAAATAEGVSLLP